MVIPQRINAHQVRHKKSLAYKTRTGQSETTHVVANPDNAPLNSLAGSYWLEMAW